MNATTQDTPRTTRRDPLTQVVDFDLLKLAFDLIVAKQDHAYWETVRTPKRPNGTVRFEALRQVATFLLPALLYVALGLLFGFKNALYGAPVYLGLGYLLDLQLKLAIRRQVKKDMELDRGRFRITQILSERLGLTPEEVTLKRVIKMSEDYMVEHTRRAQEDAARKAAEEARRREAATARNAGRRRGGMAGAVAAGAAAGAFATETMLPPAHADDIAASLPYVNPANGLPMIADTPLDIHGNVFGTNDTGYTDPQF